GNETGTTSMETAIKLLNVAKASLKELLEDYEDYLRTHNMTLWDTNNQKFINARQWCKEHNQPEDFIRVCNLRDAETVANIALIMLHQTDYLLRKLIDKFKEDFLEKGGIREQMSTARREWRDAHK
ncbi:MAG: four helix bundle suffix domain-containing protein, partial [Bacteroidales bacterium]|nr:four helix bundle suffix domain-containing protein [Bacteroidales bacterium]